jgi:hypothetical protein
VPSGNPLRRPTQRCPPPSPDRRARLGQSSGRFWVVSRAVTPPLEHQPFLGSGSSNDPAGGSPSLWIECEGVIVIDSDSSRHVELLPDEAKGVCARCGGWFPLELLAVDRKRPSGRKPMCKRCDSERSLARYYRLRGGQPMRRCSECGAELEGRQRVVCSSRCREARFRRLHPESYAAREARKAERRRQARRRASEEPAPPPAT